MFLAFLIACTSPKAAPSPIAERSHAEAPPAGMLPPPLRLALGPLIPGSRVRATMQPLATDDELVVTWGTAGIGAGPCPAMLGGTCLDVVSATVADRADVNAVGLAEAKWWLGSGATGTVAVQALVMHADGTVTVFPAEERVVEAPGTSVVGDLIITARSRMLTQKVVAVSGDVIVEDPAVDSVDLSSLERVGGSLRIWETDGLDHLVFPELIEVVGDLSIYGNQSLEELQAPKLQRVGQSLSLNRNPSLKQLSFGRLEEVGRDLYVFHNERLTHLRGFPELSSVGLAAEIWENEALQSIELDELQQVFGRIDLFENNELTSISLASLESVGTYELHHNDSLTGVGALPSLVTAGNVTLKYNASLQDTSGFATLADLTGTFFAEHNGLVSISLAGLTTAGGLNVSANNDLLAVEAPLLEEASLLQVINNGELTTLEFPALVTLATAAIGGNSSLSTCAVEDLLIQAGSPLSVCSDNLPDGCNTVCIVDTGP